MSRKISSFEEARRTLKMVLVGANPYDPHGLSRPNLVEVRTKPIKEEVSYKDVLKDLYISYLEDEDDRREYWDQVKEFEEWYSEMPFERAKWLVERLVLNPAQALSSYPESLEILERYFKGISRESLIRKP